MSKRIAVLDVRASHGAMWAFKIAGALGIIAIACSALSLAQGAAPAPTDDARPITDAFTARQQAWNRKRSPALPSASALVQRGNVDFSPPASCDTNCATSTSQCLAACPGGTAIDRLSPASDRSLGTGLDRCRTECLTAHSSCAVGCSKARPDPVISRPPTAPGDAPPVRPLVPVEPTPPITPTPIEPPAKAAELPRDPDTPPPPVK